MQLGRSVRRGATLPVRFSGHNSLELWSHGAEFPLRPNDFSCGEVLHRRFDIEACARHAHSDAHLESTLTLRKLASEGATGA
jgi:hypothetical protein